MSFDYEGLTLGFEHGSMRCVTGTMSHSFGAKASHARRSLDGMDYAGAVSTQRGRCHRYIYDDQGKPANCPKPPVATGWTQIGPKWHQVDACTEHANQLRKLGPYRAPTDADIADQN